MMLLVCHPSVLIGRIQMSAMKRFAEDVSVDMGYDGEINDEVLAEAHRRLDATSDNTDNSVGTDTE